MNTAAACTVGLRIDVDTLRGTRDGVPRLLEIFARRGIQASFFFTVGPDNMGRHLWRLIRPGFLLKMLRSNAASLYGWDILLRGTIWPGPLIGKSQADVIRNTAAHGHEIGLHAWDHHHWQTRLEHMTPEEIRTDIQRGMDALQDILDARPTCSATAGWKCNDDVLKEKNAFWFHYNSDCRGTSIFRPVVNGTECSPQIPVTLPTYDELIGRNGITDKNYNEFILSALKPDALNVLTIHAEVEGIARSGLFTLFLDQAEERQVRFQPLGNLLPPLHTIPPGSIRTDPVAGREGGICLQTGENLQ